MQEISMEARRKAGMGGGSIAGGVERKEGGRN